MNVILTVSLNMFAIYILLIFILSLFHKNRKVKNRNDVLLLIIYVFLFLLFDTIYSSMFAIPNDNFLLLQTFFYNIKFLLAVIMIHSWTKFCFGIIWGKNHNKNLLVRLSNIYLIFNGSLVLINIFIPVLFELLPGKKFYPIQPLVAIFSLTNLLVIFLTGIACVKNKTRLHKGILIPMLLLPIPPVIAEAYTIYSGKNYYSCMICLAAVILYIANSVYDSQIDELTNLDNRSSLNEHLNNLIDNSSKDLICSLVLDLEGLAETNELYGHNVGDKKIIRLSRILVSLKSKEINVIRYGGDEFLLIWASNDSNDINRVQNVIEEETIKLNSKLAPFEQIRFSISSMNKKRCEVDLEIYTKAIDDALKNRHSVMERIIDEALTNNHFEIYFQPIYDIKKQKFTIAEVLLRLVNSPYGEIPIFELITAAEKTGQINAIGEFVLNETCKFIINNNLQELGINHLSVNLSLSQYMDESLLKHILEIVDGYKIDHRKISFEILETNVSLSNDMILKNVNKLSSENFYISIDDFGDGYSNLHRLISMKFKYVKLDKSIVNHPDVLVSSIVLSHFIKIMHELHCEVIAEGVETAEKVETIRKLNVDHIQGYYYSKPIPENDFIKFIKEKNQ